MRKRIENVLFVQLSTSKWYGRREIYKPTKIPPIGLLSISSFLKMNGFKNIKVLDFLAKSYSKEDFSKLITEHETEVVGIGIYAESYRHSMELANFVKSINPKIILVAGGNFSTFIYEEILSNKSFDFVVRGEGEVTMLELMIHLNYKNCGLPLNKIKGLVYRDDNNNVIVNEDRPHIKNLNVLPFYDRNQEIVDLFEPSMNTSRGCPAHCIYCSARAFWGSKYRMRSAENVFSEIFYMYKKYKVIKKLNITEDTFTASVKRIKQICAYIKHFEVKINFWCESRVDVLTKEVLKEMKEAGLLSVQLGVESGVQEIVDSIGKNITLAKVEQVLQWIVELNIYRVHCGFMIGHPDDTHETIQKTIDFANYIQGKYGASVEVGINTPFPGTFEYENAEKLGIKIHTKDWNQFVTEQAIINTKFITKDDLQKYLLEFRMKNRTSLKIS